jgi:hypothetical protein
VFMARNQLSGRIGRHTGADRQSGGKEWGKRELASLNEPRVFRGPVAPKTKK